MPDFYMLQAPLACMLVGEGDKEEEMVLKKGQPQFTTMEISVAKHLVDFH